MDSFAVALVSNPLYYAGAALALCAAAGVLLFMWGFGSGVGNLFHMHGNDDHLLHARVRVVQGLYICMAVLGIWELIRVLLGEAPVGSTLILAAILLSPVWLPWLKGLFNK